MGYVEAVWRQLSPRVRDAFEQCAVGESLPPADEALIDPAALLAELVTMPEGALPRLLSSDATLSSDIADVAGTATVPVVDLFEEAAMQALSRRRERVIVDDLIFILAADSRTGVFEVLLDHGLTWSMLRSPGRLQGAMGFGRRRDFF